jgi:hypothetical protein
VVLTKKAQPARIGPVSSGVREEIEIELIDFEIITAGIDEPGRVRESC